MSVRRARTAFQWKDVSAERPSTLARAGNVTAEARPGGTYGYTYNAAGRMSEFKINGVLQASYK